MSMWGAVEEASCRSVHRAVRGYGLHGTLCANAPRKRCHGFCAYTPRKRRCGFTLMEVLLAITLFVVASGVLAGAIYSGLQAYRGAQSDSVLENRYRLVLRQVLLISERTEFERGGTLRLPDGTQADWDATIEADSQLLDLFNVNVVVRLSGDLPASATTTAAQSRHERDFNLYLHRANWSDSGDRGRLLEERRRALEDRRERR